MNDIFLEITIVLVLGTVLGAIAGRLRQPTILGYIATGLIVGPFGLMRLNNTEVLDAMAQIGITLLLFLVGMELRFKELRSVGKAALYTGIGQIVFTSALGFLIAKLFGYSTTAALYIAVALTFSSTIIVVKLLAEKNVLDSLYGKIVVGFLLVQDFVAIIALILLSGIEPGQTSSLSLPVAALAITLIKGGALFFGALFLGRTVVPRMLHFVGHSQEALFLTSLAWGLGIAALVTIPQIGFSIEIGGFLAGLALAESVEHFQISSRIKSLRDFFIVMFFIVLGSKMVLGNLAAIWQPTLVFSAFVLIGNPLIVMLIMGSLGYRSRTSFLASVTVAQISEFSLILAALGHRLGHIDENAVSLITAVGIVTITLSSYLIIYDEAIFRLLRGPLRFFEFRAKKREDTIQVQKIKDHIVLVGSHRMGQNILRSLESIRREFIVVDFNPDVVSEIKARGDLALYGDISDPDIQEAAGLDKARLVISTAPNIDDSLNLLSFMSRHNPKAKVILTAQSEPETERLYKAGADYVLLPHFIGGLQLAHTIKNDRELRSLAKMRRQDLAVIGKHA